MNEQKKLKSLVKNTYIQFGGPFVGVWKVLVDKTDLKIGFMPKQRIFCCNEDGSITGLFTEFDFDYIRENCVNLKAFLESGQLLQRGDVWLTDGGSLNTVKDKDFCNRTDSYDDKRYVIYAQCWLEEPTPKPKRHPHADMVIKETDPVEEAAKAVYEKYLSKVTGLSSCEPGRS